MFRFKHNQISQNFLETSFFSSTITICKNLAVNIYAIKYLPVLAKRHLKNLFTKNVSEFLFTKNKMSFVA